MTDDSTRVTVAQLNRIYWAVDRLTDLEGQDADLVIDMSQQMLADVIEGRGLAPLLDYVGKYCDVADSDADRERITAEIIAMEPGQS